MQSRSARIGLLAVLVAAAENDEEHHRGGDDEPDSGPGTAAETTATATTPTQGAPTATLIEVKDGTPVGGVQTIEARKGERVGIEVQLDRPEEEVHVHGYELTKPAEKSPVRFSFPADLEGVFEVEVHREDGSDVQIAELRVNP